MEAKASEITCLTQFRNEIAYVIRNPYVIRADINPLAYQWCSGYLVFNPFLCFLESKTVDGLTYREKRSIARSSEADLDSSFRVRDGMIVPESFVNYRLVEQLFPCARKFTWWVFKNVEAQVEVASGFGEKPNLSDDELFVVTMRLCESRFNMKGAKDLTEQQKKQLAVILKNEWYASNGQTARLTQLPLQIVNALFPLTAKPSIP